MEPSEILSQNLQQFLCEPAISRQPIAKQLGRPSQLFSWGWLFLLGFWEGRARLAICGGARMF